MLHACSICKKQFVFKKQLDEHLLEDHGAKVDVYKKAGTLLDQWQCTSSRAVDEDNPTVQEMLSNLEDHINRQRQAEELRRATVGQYVSINFARYQSYVQSLAQGA